MLLTHYRDLMRPSEAAKYWQLAPETPGDAKIIPLAEAYP
jgi:hypothetical protein